MNITPEIMTFLTAMTPIGELRVALPLALIGYNINIWLAYILAVSGNILPVFLLLLFWRYLLKFLIERSKILRIFFDWLFEHTRRKFLGKYEQWGKIALVLFVAIPLPVTGAWTGSVAAWLFGYRYWESLILIFLGVLISGIIVSLLTLGGINFITLL